MVSLNPNAMDSMRLPVLLLLGLLAACGGTATPDSERELISDVVLAPDAEWELDWLSATARTLELRVLAEGEGVLRVRCTAVDPLGGLDAPGQVRVNWRFEPGPGRRGLSLPQAPHGRLRIGLTWEPDQSDPEEATPLRVQSLRVLEGVAPPRPSILLISLDTLSARHLSLYGYGRPTSPFLERWARDAVVFERCTANAPWTSPSYMSLFTGLFPSSVRMDLGQPGQRFMFRIPEQRWTLAESLRGLGYSTAAFLDALHIGPRFGFGQGFEHVDQSAAEIDLADPNGGLRHGAPLALEWMRAAQADGPFFCFVHAYDVHGPYLPDEPYAGRFTGDAHSDADARMFLGALPHVFGSIPSYITEPSGIDADAAGEGPSAPFVAAYDEEILALDAALEEFLTEAEAQGLLENTIVVITADHGEATDDHDYFDHGLLFDEVLHVPLLVRLPGNRGAGRRVSDSVQLVDLYPTLVDLAAGALDWSWAHGRSLVPLLEGRSLPAVPVFAEGGIQRESAIEFKGWKLIETYPGQESLPWTKLSHPRLPAEWIAQHAPEVYGKTLTLENVQRLQARFENQPDGRAAFDAWVADLSKQLGGPYRELYHLDSDPAEREDRSASEPEQLEHLLELLEVMRQRREEAATHQPDERVQLEANEVNALRDMGYVGGD